MQLATHFASSANSLRARDGYLSEDAIRSAAPSIFAIDKHESRSERYTYVPTIDVVRGLQREGFQPVAVTQSRCKDEGKREFTKHMLRLRRDFDPAVVGAEIPEIILVNSHDGTTSYQMLAGMFRFVCSNGMVVASGCASEVRVSHKGDVVGQVIEGAFEIVKDFDNVIESKERMKALATTALSVRYPDEAEANSYPVTVESVLRPTRGADSGTDLWTTFNVIQEKLVKGGLHSTTANGRRARTREVTGISQNVALNRALWQLADGMAKLKAAH